MMATKEQKPIQDPEVEPKLRSCHTCLHMKTCKILTMARDTKKAFDTFAKQEGIDVILPFEPEQIAPLCPEFLSVSALDMDLSDGQRT